MAESLILCDPNSNPNLNIWDLNIKAEFFVEIIVDQLKTWTHTMKAVPKWLLINRPKTPEMPQNLHAQIACPSPKLWDFDEKRLHWASVVRVLTQGKTLRKIRGLSLQ